MKRGMSYRRCLCLVVVFLQIIVSGYLEVTLYRDVVTDLRTRWSAICWHPELTKECGIFI